MAIKSKKRLLVIEDNPEIVKVYKVRLANANYVIDVAYDGIEALKMAKESSYDCILSDVILLGSASGKDIALQLRALPQTARTPIIFLTNTLPFFKDKGNETIEVGSFK